VGSCGLIVYISGQGPVAGSFEHGNKPSGSIMGGEFLDLPSNYWPQEGLCSME
jgi:hypothetical protein